MTMKTYRAVIFDLDGTLLDNDMSFKSAFLTYCDMHPDVFEQWCTEERDDLIRIYRAPNRSEAYSRFCRKWNWRSAPDFESFWQEWFTTYVNSAVLFPWVPEVLEYLRQKGLKLGMITNGAGEYQYAKIKHAGISGFFDDILVSGDLGMKKPSAEIFHLSAEHLQVPVPECLFVGDTPETDIIGAQNAGMDSLMLTGKTDTIGATYTASDITFLKKLF